VPAGGKRADQVVDEHRVQPRRQRRALLHASCAREGGRLRSADQDRGQRCVEQAHEQVHRRTLDTLPGALAPQPVARHRVVGALDVEERQVSLPPALALKPL
jgi:hypothetical protein